MDNFPHRELNPCLLQCKQGVLTTGPTGKFELIFFFQKKRKNNVITLSTMVLLTVITSFNILWHVYGRPLLPRSDFSILHKGGVSPLSLLI